MCTTNCSHCIDCESRDGFYRCNCQAGFTGPHCDINIDECSSSPCVNGKCEDGINRYDCVCSKGYWGTTCENKIKDEGGMFLRPTLHCTISLVTFFEIVFEVWLVHFAVDLLWFTTIISLFEVDHAPFRALVFVYWWLSWDSDYLSGPKRVILVKMFV